MPCGKIIPSSSFPPTATEPSGRYSPGFGFDPFFREIFGSDFHFSKKEKIDHALEKYGIPREQAFYIGDTVGDILEARAAGVRSVAVTWGWHDRERLVAVSPDFIVDTPEGLLSLASAVGSER